MKASKRHLKAIVAAGSLLLSTFAGSQIGNAATNYLDFYSTVVSTLGTAQNPANGVVAISGNNLSAGDVVVLDGVAITQNATPGADQWAAFELNQGGNFGLTAAALAVKAETADGYSYSQLYPGPGTSFGDVGAATNHVRIVLTATATGSTTNMTYLAETDPNFTGTFSDALSGSVTFSGNTIALTFASHVQGQTFYDTSGSLAISATPTNTLKYAIGETPTFAASYQGPPSGVSFQWLSNNVPIAGANSLTYTIAPITASNNGDRYAIVLLTNSINVVTSAPCVLNSRTSAAAVTNYLDFYNTIVAAGNGPVNPANGAVAISGLNLALGDSVVFDGVAISQNATPGVDQWAGIDLNGAGLQGVTMAALGVKAETADGYGPSQLFPGAGTSFGDVGAATNHVRIILTATATGSTTNMSYLAETDPNFTGTTFYPLSGTVTFPSNTIALGFGAHVQPQAFYDNSGALAISASPSSSDPLLAGNAQTFTAIYQGPPSGLNYSFQWLSNNVPIAGANSLAYTTLPIAAANNGDLYSVVLLTNSVNAVTSAPCLLNYHAGPATWVFNFPNYTWTGGGSTNTPIVSTITDLANFAPGDTVVFDGIITGNGPWGGPVINGPANNGSANLTQQLTGAGFGVLLRFGGNGANGAVYANAVNVNNNLTTVAAVTNHLRIELYISTQGSLANMGWKVLLDQNLTGTYSIMATGTNLTFNASSLWLSLDSQNCSSISFAQYQNHLLGASTIGYSGGPFTYNGLGQSPSITFSGSTGARTTNYTGVSVVYSGVNAPTNAGNYYVSNTVAADANYFGTNSSQAFTINPRPITVTAQANTKLFDNTTSAIATPVLTSGTIASGDTAFYTEAYQNANPGTGKTLIPSVTVTNVGNANVSADYAVTLVNNTTGVINAVVPVVSGAKLSGGMFQVTFTGPAGQSYEVLSTTNVAAPLGSWVTNSSGTFPGGNVTYPQSATGPNRFFLIKSP